MSSMHDDINKYAAIWDAAQAKGIFPETEKPVHDVEDAADFFGQQLNARSEGDRSLNESDTKYWAKLSRMADPLGKYVDPLCEETVPSKAEAKKVADTVASAHNPIYPTTVGKDQDAKVTQNWGVGGKEHFQLEDLKTRLHDMESRLNKIEGMGKSGTDMQGKIDSIKQQIEDLGNSLNGNKISG